MTNPEPVPVDLTAGENTADLTITPPDFCCQDSDAAGWGDDDEALNVELDNTDGGVA